MNITFCGSCGLMRIACSEFSMALSDFPSRASAKLEISVGGGEIRIEVERPSELCHRLVGPSLVMAHAQRDVGPRVAIVELGRPPREPRRLT